MTVSLNELYRLSMQLTPEERRRLAEYLLDPPSAPSLDHVLATLTAHANDLRTLGVTQIGVFGSVARGGSDAANDIDILVTMPEKTFRNFMHLKFMLDDLFVLPVDLVLEESLRDELRSHVMHEVKYAEGLQALFARHC